MFDFIKLPGGMYLPYRNGVRASDVPMTRSELFNYLCTFELTESELQTIEAFY